MHLSRRSLRLPFTVPHLYAVTYQASSYTNTSSRQLGIALPEELGRAVAKRKASFLAGRHCARGALADAGVRGSTSLGIGINRSPIWPPGFGGSITHTANFAAATVDLSCEVAGIGIDVESIMDADTCRVVGNQVMVPEDWTSAPWSDGSSERSFVSLVFSAKEAIFKCLYPLVGAYFDFEHVALVQIDPIRGQFRFRVLRDLSRTIRAGFEADGNFAIIPEGVLTFVALARSPSFGCPIGE